MDKPVDKPESHTAQSALFHGSNRASLSARSSAQRHKDAAAVTDSIFQIDHHPRKSCLEIDRSRLVSQAQYEISLSPEDAVRLPCDLQRSKLRRVLNQPTAAIKHTKEQRAESMKNIGWGVILTVTARGSARQYINHRSITHFVLLHQDVDVVCSCSLVDMLSAHTSLILVMQPLPHGHPVRISCDYVKMDCRFLSMYSSRILPYKDTARPPN